jgi:serine/threonine-protein kinase
MNADVSDCAERYNHRRMPPHPQPEKSSESFAQQPRGARLDSWKEIAAHLQRDVATVRRWEKREGLPVHRHIHAKLGSVFAYSAELDAWRAGRRRAESITTPLAASRWRAALPWVLAAALGLAAVLILWAPWQQPSPSRASLRFSADLGDDVVLAASRVQFGDAVALSPDDSVIAFVAERGAGTPQIYVRRLDQLTARPLSGTDDALAPFFSPDGGSIGFFAGGKLKTITLAGGSPVTLADAPSARGGSWGPDNTIVFSPARTPGTRLFQVSSAGKKAAEPLTTLVDGEVIQLWPQVLPGGRAVLFTGSNIIGSYNDANLVVQSLPGGTREEGALRGTRKVVHVGGYHARYLPSGHLTFMHDGTLFAAPFDLDQLQVKGPPVAVLTGVNSNSQTGGAQFAASDTGTLAYLPGQTTGVRLPIEWMDRQGTTTPLRVTPANWVAPRFSPDGQRLAMEIRDGSSHVWVYDWARDKLRRLTSDAAEDLKPVWTPDSQRLAFASPRADGRTANLYWQRADGTGRAQRLTESSNPQQPFSWHPNGRYLAFAETTSATGVDVMVLPMERNEDAGWKPGKATAFVSGPSTESDPMFSPDGRWLAYTSNESGHPEVFVQPFPGPGARSMIGAGVNPTWSRRELFYGIDGQIMVVPYSTSGGTFRAEHARPWSNTRLQMRGPVRMFDVHPDGERLAIALADHPAAGAKSDKLVFVLNFFDELRRIASATPK